MRTQYKFAALAFETLSMIVVQVISKDKRLMNVV